VLLTKGAHEKNFTESRLSSPGVFLPTGKFSGMEFRTSNLSLLVDPDFSGPGNFRTEHTLPGVANLHPGMPQRIDDFLVRNASDQGQQLRVSAQLSPGNKDWESIKHLVTMSIYSHQNGQSTPEYTLAEWTESAKDLPHPVLFANTTYGFQLRFKMLETYSYDPDGDGHLQAGDEISHEMMNKVTQNAALVLSGKPEVL
jgi:hypothetical protein